LEKTRPSAALSTTNPTCCPDSNPGSLSGKPATNRLSYGTANLAELLYIPILEGGTQKRSWLRHYATSQKVAGSNSDEVVGFFNLPNLTTATG
jgi:hypothetical protein